MFTAEQAVREGWTERQIKRRRETGAWRPVVGKGLTADPEPSHLQGCWAVALTWRDRVVSHVSAAQLRGWPVPVGPTVHVTSPRTLRRSPGLAVHRSALCRPDVTLLRGAVPATSSLRTALDCLATLPFARALDLYAWLSTRELFGRSELAAGIRARTGRRGTEQLVSLLRITRTGAVSGGEFTLHEILRAAGITGWRANAHLLLPDGTRAVADILFDEALLIIEFDGQRAHDNPTSFVRDRRRQNALQRHGYLVLRYTWADLRDRPDEVVREILAVLATRRSA